MTDPFPDYDSHEAAIDQAGYPSANLERMVTPPIGTGEVSVLIERLAGLHRFRGAWTIDESGKPVLIMQAPDEPTFQECRHRPAGLIVWNWNSPYGSHVGFTIAGPKQGQIRMFVPENGPAIKALRLHGEVSVAVSFRGAITAFHRANFKAPSKTTADPFKALETVLSFPQDSSRPFDDYEVAYWMLMGNPRMHWHKELPTEDILRAGWARAYDLSMRGVEDHLRQFRELSKTDPYLTEDARTNIPLVFPCLAELLELLVTPTATLKEIIAFLDDSREDPVKVRDIVSGVIGAKERSGIDAWTAHIAFDLFCASMMSPASTRSGLRRAWIDGFEAGDGMRVQYFELDAAQIGKPHCPEYWNSVPANEVLSAGQVLSTRDIPIPPLDLSLLSAELRLDGSDEDCVTAIRALLAEARENRQWSAPWGARVQLTLGIFRYIEIFELEGEFIGLFRDRDDRYLWASVNTEKGVFKAPTLQHANEERTEVVENIGGALSIVLILASIVRDFLVVDTRESVFGTRRAKAVHCPTNSELSIVYIPRVRYVSPNVAAVSSLLDDYAHRAAHDVLPHLRRSEKASPGQRLLALRYGFDVPQGYTFVRPHRRGDEAIKDKQHIYRSRSATKAIFQEIAQTPKGTRPAWFDFEKDVAIIMSSKGLSIVHQEASRNGDGGVDIYAYNDANDSTWAIQCKCYASARKVGPDVIRELIGSLTRYPSGTLGMVVTTSSFTEGARELAKESGIKTIDGVEFASLVKHH